MGQHVIQPYVYANGAVYRPNLKVIYTYNDGYPDYPVGGAVILKDKVLAFVADAPTIILQGKIATIIRDADHYVWGQDLTEALRKIKPYLPNDR